MREHKNNRRPRNIKFGKLNNRPTSNANNPAEAQYRSRAEEKKRLLERFHRQPQPANSPNSTKKES